MRRWNNTEVKSWILESCLLWIFLLNFVWLQKHIYKKSNGHLLHLVCCSNRGKLQSNPLVTRIWTRWSVTMKSESERRITITWSSNCTMRSSSLNAGGLDTKNMCLSCQYQTFFTEKPCASRGLLFQGFLETPTSIQPSWHHQNLEANIARINQKRKVSKVARWSFHWTPRIVGSCLSDEWVQLYSLSRNPRLRTTKFSLNVFKRIRSVAGQLKLLMDHRRVKPQTCITIRVCCKEVEEHRRIRLLVGCGDHMGIFSYIGNKISQNLSFQEATQLPCPSTKGGVNCGRADAEDGGRQLGADQVAERGQ